MAPRLLGQVAIVTGGSAGIGQETCFALARQGAHVVIVGRNRERLAETAARTGEAGAAHSVRALALALDVRSEPDMQEMAERTLEAFGKVDILISSAGILRASGAALRTVAQMPIRDWDEVLDINLRGTFLSNRAVLPAMVRQRKGDIVNLSSKSGKIGLAYDAPYCASKFAVIGLSESLAQEVGTYGVRVQVLLPGTFDTGVWSQTGPLPRPGDLPPATRVTDLILFMITLPPDARLVTPLIEPLAPYIGSGWRGSKGSGKG
jgi:NAD(P)-dependent dehydrogenase (short-subunit alcohol dehydrogenase family)